jgi:hypothetical protein
MSKVSKLFSPIATLVQENATGRINCYKVFKLTKFSRMTIPKSEDDIKKISEEIMQQEHQVVELGAEEAEEGTHMHAHGEADLSVIIHELNHMQELLLHVIQAIRELRDSVDNLDITIRKSLRALALLQVANSLSDAESRHRLLEQVSKDLGVDVKKYDK